MRRFIDTEFNDRPQDGAIDLISIGMVREDGNKSLYRICANGFDPDRCSPWVRDNVLAKLEKGFGYWKTAASIRKDIEDIIHEDAEPPEFWGYFADYDWVLFCQLFGGMLKLPKGWPQLCFDLRQEMSRVGVTKAQLPPIDPTQAHNALFDAKWTRDSFLWLQEKGARWVK